MFHALRVGARAVSNYYEAGRVISGVARPRGSFPVSSDGHPGTVRRSRSILRRPMNGLRPVKLLSITVSTPLTSPNSYNALYPMCCIRSQICHTMLG